jgi:hypothetical protein
MSIYIPPTTSTGVTLEQMENYVSLEITQNLSNYLEKSGGTISGNLDVTNTLENDNLTPNTVVTTNSSKILTSSSVSTTTLGYLDATSSVQTQLNSKQNALSGLTSGDYIKATGSGTIGNASVLSESGSNLSVAGSLNLTPTTDGIILTISNHSGSDIFQINSTTGLVSSLINFLIGGSYGTSSTTSFQVSTHGNVPVFTVDNSTPQINIGTNIYPSNTNTNNLGNSTNTWAGVAANNIVAENGTVYNYCQSLTLGLINSNYGIYTTMTAGTANYYLCFASGTGWFTNASILPSSDGYSGLGSSGQRWSNLFTQQATITPASDGNAFVVKAAGGSSVLTVNTSTNTVSAAGNLQVGANLTFASNSYNSGTALLCPATTYSGSFYAPTALNNAFVANNGTSNYFNVNGSTLTTQVANLALTGTNGGTILYNSSNSSAGTGYPTMDALYTFEYIVTASNIPASATMVGGFIPFPAGKSGANLRKLDVSMYDGTYFVPALFGIITPAYAFAIASSPSGIFIDTASTWTQTTGSKTFYVWITTN